MSLLRLFFSPFVILFVMVACCSNLNQVTEPITQDRGIALLKIAASNGLFQKIARKATLTVSANDMLTINKMLAITDSGIQGILDIPSGKNRLFSVTVYDSMNVLQYKGSSTADVIADTTVKITISIIRVSGKAVINGNIVEGDSTGKAAITRNVIESGSTLKDSLIAYYTFSGNAKDSSGKGNTGIVRGATLTSDRFGSANSAYMFDSTNSIDLSLLTELNNASSVTLNVWINLTSYYPSNDSRAIFWHWIRTGGGSGPVGIAFSIYSHGSILTGVNGGQNIYTDSNKIELGKWAMITLVYDGSAVLQSDKLYTYVNGEKIPFTNFSVATALPSTLGVSSTFSRIGNNFVGKIDDLRIYKRVLSFSEIDALYHSGAWAGN